MQQSVAMLAGYCQRNAVGVVTYDDSVQTYMPSFPWFTLRAMLASKLQEFGIAVSEPRAAQ